MRRAPGADNRNYPEEYTNLAMDPDHKEILAKLIEWVPKDGAPEFRVPSEHFRKRRQ